MTPNERDSLAKIAALLGQAGQALLTLAGEPATEPAVEPQREDPDAAANAAALAEANREHAQRAIGEVRRWCRAYLENWWPRIKNPDDRALAIKVAAEQLLAMAERPDCDANELVLLAIDAGVMDPKLPDPPLPPGAAPLLDEDHFRRAARQEQFAIQRRQEMSGSGGVPTPGNSGRCQGAWAGTNGFSQRPRFGGG